MIFSSIPYFAKSGKVLDFFRIFLPLECPVCGGVPFDGTPNMLCAECMGKVDFLKGPFCPGCGGEYSGFLDICPSCLSGEKRYWEGAVSAFQMTEFVKELLHRFKYRKQPELGAMLGRLAYYAVRERFPDVDCVVPVPLHWRRMLLRGFNQSEELAKPLAEGAGVPLERLIYRRKYTKQQAKLGKRERKTNLSGAFSVFDSTKVKKRAILLVDDVMTTGSTLSAAAMTLKRAGASKVYVFTAARRQRI